MNSNLTAFSAYAASILDALHGSFPVCHHLELSNIVRPYLGMSDADFEKLRDDVQFGSILQELGQLTEQKNDPEAADGLARIKNQLNAKESECAQWQSEQMGILEGTLEFLIAEGYVRRFPSDYPSETTFQLTARGFTILNKEFEDGNFTSGKQSYIAVIRKMISNPSTFVGSIASRSLVDLITRLIASPSMIVT